ncbi:MAG: hypothetical protein C0392_03375, partial [Syntrophus sp. (in: bacteria)]|nr:hypothetical protein [Syntrophus sp. (in: bacteria)]
MKGVNSEKNTQRNLLHILLIASTTIATILVSLYYLSSGIFILFQNFLYIPIVLSCLYYRFRGFVYSVCLSILYLILILAFTSESSIVWQSLARAGIFIVIAGIVSFLTARRKQALQSSRENEETFNRLFENSTDPVLIHVREGFVDCNAACVAILGYTSKDEVLNKKPWDISPEYQPDGKKSSEKAEELIDLAMSKGHQRFEWVHLKSDGTQFIVDIMLTPIMIRGTQFLYVVWRDITERKQADEERKAHNRFLESLAQVDQAIKSETDVEQMLWNAIKAVFSIFDCDRAWLFYPCDPDAPSFRIPVEICRPEYPGAQVLNVDVPMSPDLAQDLREIMESDDPVIYTAGTEKPINKVTAEQFGVQSQMTVPLYPKSGKPWVFGMHQCSFPRIWTDDEKHLFKEIARRMSDGLSSVLYLRELQESEG